MADPLDADGGTPYPATIGYSVHTGPPLWSAGGYQFAMVLKPEPNLNEIICRRLRGTNTWTTFDLSTLAGNPFELPCSDSDGHTQFSVAVDSAGKIHVTGNHHSSTMHYMRSTNAYDITAWTNAQTASVVGAAGHEVTYTMYGGFSDGTLILVCRRGYPGGAVTMWMEKLLPGDTAWTAVGDITTATTPAASYQQQVFIDIHDRMHVMFIWDSDSGAALNHNTDLSYIYSDDQGTTWKSLNGTAMTLPITTANDTAANTGVTPPSPTLHSGGLIVDEQGYPHTVIPYSAYNIPHHVWWDGSAWQGEDLTPLTGASGRGCLTSRNGELWILIGGSNGTGGRRLRAIRLRDGAMAKFGTTGVYFEPWIDPKAWLTYGTTEVLMPAGATPRVYTLGDGTRART